MKGYIYLLKEKKHTNTYKIGRTNDLARRLSQYNNGNTNIPDSLLEMEGDILKPQPFSKLDEDYKQKFIQKNDLSKMERILKDEIYIQL